MRKKQTLHITKYSEFTSLQIADITLESSKNSTLHENLIKYILAPPLKVTRRREILG